MNGIITIGIIETATYLLGTAAPTIKPRPEAAHDREIPMNPKKLDDWLTKHENCWNWIDRESEDKVWDEKHQSWHYDESRDFRSDLSAEICEDIVHAWIILSEKDSSFVWEQQDDSLNSGEDEVQGVEEQNTCSVLDWVLIVAQSLEDKNDHEGDDHCRHDLHVTRDGNSDKIFEWSLRDQTILFSPIGSICYGVLLFRKFGCVRVFLILITS